MLTTHSPSPREASMRRASSEPPSLDPATWEKILSIVRSQHPSLNRVWFDQMTPRQLTNGVIQVTVQTPAQLNFCQGQCQQPFNSAAQQVTGRLIVVSFHCETLGRGGVFNEGDQPLPLNPDYVFDSFVTGPCNRLFPRPSKSPAGLLSSAFTATASAGVESSTKETNPCRSIPITSSTAS